MAQLRKEASHGRNPYPRPVSDTARAYRDAAAVTDAGGVADPTRIADPGCFADPKGITANGHELRTNAVRLAATEARLREHRATAISRGNS